MYNKCNFDNFNEKKNNHHEVLFHHRSPYDSHIIDGAVVVIRANEINLFRYFIAINDLSKHGVLPIKVGCAAIFAVMVSDVLGEFCLSLSLLVKEFLVAVEVCLSEGLAHNDIEL